MLNERESCQQFVKMISQHISVKDLGNSGNDSDSQPMQVDYSQTQLSSSQDTSNVTYSEKTSKETFGEQSTFAAKPVKDLAEVCYT